MAKQSTNSIKLDNFIGGINESVDNTLIKSNESPNAQNCNVDDGTLSNCNGYGVYYNTPYSSIGTLMAYYQDTDKTLLYATGGKIYKKDGTQIDTGLANNNFDFLNFKINEDLIIYTNGVNKMRSYNNNTIKELKNRRKAYNDDGSPNGFYDANNVHHATEDTITTYAPLGDFLELHFERLWTAKGDTLYFSTADRNGFDIEDWTAPIEENEANQHGGTIELPTFDGGKIIGLKVIFNDIVIFKNRNVFKIFGTSPSNYDKVQLFSSNGAIADKSIVTALNKAYFVALEGIFAYDGTNVLNISEKIKNTWNTLNKDYLNKAVAIFYKNKYILAVPEGNSTVNNLIIEYNTVTNTFMFIRGISVNSFLEFDNKLLFVNDNSKIYEYNVTDKFETSNINSYWYSGQTNLNVPNAIKVSDYLYFTGKGNGSIKISSITERQTSETIVPLTPTETPYRVKLKNKGRNMQLKIENINGSSFTIKKPELMLELDID